MRIAIIGAGALGSFVGAKLSQRHEVVLVCRRAHADAIIANGLRISGKTELLVHPSVACSYKELEDNFGNNVDLAIFTVKAYDTYSAAKEYKKCIANARIGALSLQNGLGNLEAIARATKKSALGGITSHGLTYLEPGRVAHTGLGRTVVGNAEVASLLSQSGIESYKTDNIEGEIWAKALVNACINPLTAVLRVKNGTLVAVPELSRLMRALFDECYEVARREARLPEKKSALEKRVFEIARLTAENRSSMLQDIDRSRKTEIGEITGEFVRRGKSHQLPMPVNETMLRLVQSIERTTTHSARSAMYP